MSTIEVKKITKKYGEFVAVKDASLSVKAGEVVCLLGPSGCGKTTTLRMIAGLERATEGDVIIAGKRMNDLSPEKRDIAMVFQFYALYPALNVGQNIAMPLHFEKLSKEETDKRVNKVAKILHLTDVLDRMPGQVSEGEKQRIAVARAIVRDPNCFLFDEPLSRLDVELRHSMRGQIKEVLSNLSKATVIVTHDQLEALTMADRIAIMRDGMIEQVGTPHEVFAKPANVFVASFIGTPQMNLMEADLKSFDKGVASVTLAGNAVEMAADPAVSTLKPSKVMIGIRPRAFTAESSASKSTIGAQAELIEPMGAETLIHARTKLGGDIRVVVPRTQKIKIGEVLHLKPDPKQTHFFGENGRAVRGMSDESQTGMTPRCALRLEYSIIGLGLFALVLIFQPFSLTLFAIGSGLVVLAGLINNLLPLAQPGVPLRSVAKVALVVAMIFCIALLVSITAAHLYGVFFLKPPDPNTIMGKAALAARPFYLHPFVWSLAVVAAGLAAIITYLNKAAR